MSKTLQFRRYTTSNLASITGASGELIVDTTLNQLTIHDGATPGGWYAANNVTLQTVWNTANTAGTIKPQNPESTNYVLQLSDVGKYIYYTNSSNVNLYIPTTANVAFANGSTITIVSHTSTANVIVTPNTGVSLYAAGNSISGNHNVTSYGVVTLFAAAANTWYIHGTGLN
jgi:hypothetical protein